MNSFLSGLSFLLRAIKIEMILSLIQEDIYPYVVYRELFTVSHIYHICWKHLTGKAYKCPSFMQRKGLPL